MRRIAAELRGLSPNCTDCLLSRGFRRGLEAKVEKDIISYTEAEALYLGSLALCDLGRRTVSEEAQELGISCGKIVLDRFSEEEVSSETLVFLFPDDSLQGGAADQEGAE